MGKKTIKNAKKVEAAAMTFIASAFIINGCIYFTPQFVYHVPRLLLPVYNLLGPIALAIGLLILGIILIYFAYKKWQKQEGNKPLFWGITAMGIITFVLINLFVGKSTKNPEEIRNEMEKGRESHIEQVKQSDRPKLSSKEANAYFNEFETLLSTYKQHVQKVNKEAMEKDQEAFNALLMKSSDAVQALSNNEKYLFSQYNAKLMIMWNEIK